MPRRISKWSSCPASSQTHTLSAAWGIRAAQIAKTLALSVGGRVVLAVVCGDSRLDNKKVKAVLGGKATMLAPEEAATITGHVLGGVCPFGLATPMPIYCDVQLRAFDEVVPGAGSTHTALRIAPRPHGRPERRAVGGHLRRHEAGPGGLVRWPPVSSDGVAPLFTREKKMLRTLFLLTILAGALTVQCVGTGAGCWLCVAFGTRGHSRRDRCGNHRARGQGSSLHEGPLNTRSAHDCLCHSARTERQLMRSRPWTIGSPASKPVATSRWKK